VQELTSGVIRLATIADRHMEDFVGQL